MQTTIIAVMLLISSALASSAQELPVEDRACITAAVAKLPPAAAFAIEGSRVVERHVVDQSQSQGRRKQNPYQVYRIKLKST